jgi:hypothetical protein
MGNRPRPFYRLTNFGQVVRVCHYLSPYHGFAVLCSPFFRVSKLERQRQRSNLSSKVVIKNLPPEQTSAENSNN